MFLNNNLCVSILSKNFPEMRKVHPLLPFLISLQHLAAATVVYITTKLAGAPASFR